jgi:hypothetical protein
MHSLQLFVMSILYSRSSPSADVEYTQLTMGTLVISAPSIPLARPAMIEFERACALFQNTEITSVQPENAAVSGTWFFSLPQCNLNTYFQVVLMDILQTARRAVDQERRLVASDGSARGSESMDVSV